MYFGSRPIGTDNLSCAYKEKQDKIVCTQIGDVVPEWLDLNQSAGLFGNKPIYSMSLIFSKGNDNYISAKMTESILIPGLKRKFIYEINEQSLTDFVRFKNFLKSSEISNFGSVALYCSESNMTESVCKELKRRYKK